MDIEKLKEQLISDPEVMRMVARRAFEIYLERRDKYAAHPSEDWLRAESEILPRLINQMVDRNQQAIAARNDEDPISSRAAEHMREEAAKVAAGPAAVKKSPAKAASRKTAAKPADKDAAGKPAATKKAAPKKAASKAPAKKTVKATAKPAAKPAVDAKATKAPARKSAARPKKADETKQS